MLKPGQDVNVEVISLDPARAQDRPVDQGGESCSGSLGSAGLRLGQSWVRPGDNPQEGQTRAASDEDEGKRNSRSSVGSLAGASYSIVLCRVSQYE